MNINSFLNIILRKYPLRLILVFLFNAITAFISLFSFIMIEPFIKLLFKGNLDGLSPISSFVIKILSNYFDLESLSSSFIVLLVGALILFLAKDVFQYLSQFVMAHIRSDVISNFRQSMYDKIISLPLSFFSNEKRGDFVSRAVSDCQECEYTVLTALYQWLTDPITLFFYLFFLFYIDYQLTLWSLLLFPITFLIIGFLSHSLRKDSKTAKHRLGTLTSFVEETIIGYKVIASNNFQNSFYEKYNELNRLFHNKQKTIYRKSYLASPLSEFLGVTIVMIVLVIGGSLVLSNRSPLSAELFITYIAVFAQIINPLKNIFSSFAEYKRGQASLDRIFHFLSLNDKIQEIDNPIDICAFNSDISIKNIDYAYSSTESVKVLKNLDFKILKGETIALVGESGSGKTTVSDLLMRFMDPINGQILIDNQDIRTLKLSQYRALLSLVSQDVVIFHDTFFNNIALGLNVDKQLVEEAARMSGIYDYIMSFPDGFNHEVGDMGNTLSGGQRQKISIARALLRNSPIIILDEATSAMDTDSERNMQKTLNELFRHKTKIVIAHRLSTIADADSIFVLSNGEIVERGTHNELLNKKGYYYKLYKIQD